MHAVHNVFPEYVESRYDRAFLQLEERCRKRSLVVVLTNVFDDVNAQIITEYLGNLTGRHLPLGVFLRDHDLFALADNAPNVDVTLKNLAELSKTVQPVVAQIQSLTQDAGRVVKAVDPAAVITDVRVEEKTGGKTGRWTRDGT